MLCKLEGSKNYTALNQQPDLGKVVEIKLSAQNAAQCASILNKVRWDKLSNLQRIVIENCEFSGYKWDDDIAFSQLQEIAFIDTIIDVDTANSLLDKVVPATVVVRVDQDCEYTAMQDDDESDFYSWDGGVDELKKRIASMDGSSQTTDEYSEFIDDSDNSKEDDSDNSKEDDWILSDYDEENSQDSDDNSNELYIEVKNDKHTLSSQQSILSQQNSWDNSSSQSSTSEKNSRQFQDGSSDNDDMSSKILSEGLTGRYRDQEVMLRRRDSLSQQYDDDSLDNFSSHRAPQTGITLTVLIGNDVKTLSKDGFDSISADERAAITDLVIDGQGQSITHINFAGLTSLNTLKVIDAVILDVSEFATDDNHDNTMFRSLTSVTINNCVVNQEGIENFLGRVTKSLTLKNSLSENRQTLSADEINKLRNFVQTKGAKGIWVEVSDEEEYDMNDFEAESISTAHSPDSRSRQYSQNSRRSATDILLDEIRFQSEDEHSQSTSSSNSQDSLSSFNLPSLSSTETRSPTKNHELTIRKKSFNDDDVSEEEQLISEYGHDSFNDEKQHLNTNIDSHSIDESVSRSDRSGSTHQSRLTSKNDSRMFTPLPNGSSHKTRHEGNGVSIDSQASTQSFKHAYGRRVRDEVSLCSQDNKHRSLKKIENAIGEGLDNHIGKRPHRDDYSTVINKQENCVSLTYESSSHKKIPVMDVRSDSLVVYRSWRENVDDSKVSIENKAMIVLAGLGIPPYPRHGVDVEGHQDSPLVGAINRILNEMKQQKDVDDQEDIQVQFRQFKN